jgi:hypothetical protein
MSFYGLITAAEDYGSVWRLVHRRDDDGSDSVYFDHRPFACFYEGATGRSFFEDYGFGAGRELISRELKGLRIRVEGDFPEQVVELE